MYSSIALLSSTFKVNFRLWIWTLVWWWVYMSFKRNAMKHREGCSWNCSHGICVTDLLDARMFPRIFLHPINLCDMKRPHPLAFYLRYSENGWITVNLSKGPHVDQLRVRRNLSKQPFPYSSRARTHINVWSTLTIMPHAEASRPAKASVPI